jgi:hypothetical protein
MGMTTSMTATVVDAVPLAHVRLDVAIDNAEAVLSWSITRDAPGQTVKVYIGAACTAAMSLVDDTAPLGVPVTYHLTVIYATSTTYVDAAPVTITGTVGCFLTNPASGVTLPVEISTWPSRKRVARQAVLEVLGRADPVGLTDAHTTPVGLWTLLSRTDAYTDALTSLLTAQDVVILRTQPGSSIASCTALVGDVDEQRFSQAGGDQRRLFDVDVQEIAPLPATALPLNATLGGLAIYPSAPGGSPITTLAQLADLRVSLVALSQIETG